MIAEQSCEAVIEFFLLSFCKPAVIVCLVLKVPASCVARQPDFMDSSLGIEHNDSRMLLEGDLLLVGGAVVVKQILMSIQQLFDLPEDMFCAL